MRDLGEILVDLGGKFENICGKFGEILGEFGAIFWGDLGKIWGFWEGLGWIFVRFDLVLSLHPSIQIISKFYIIKVRQCKKA